MQRLWQYNEVPSLCGHITLSNDGMLLDAVLLVGGVWETPLIKLPGYF